MRKTRVCLMLGCCIFAVVLFAWAQSTRKPGLWETTANMTWQKSPMPAGMTIPGTGPQTTQVCLTQAWIDRYGAPVTQNRDCRVTNVMKKSNGMTASLVCSGKMNGKGTVEASWEDSYHATGKIHFVGVMQFGPNPMPIEWTVDSTSVYQSADCGSVNPLPIPGK